MPVPMGCRTVDNGGSTQRTALGFPTPSRIFANISGLNRVLRFPRLRRWARHRRADYVQGSFLVIPKRVFDRCGGFDERFFLYGEDADLCLRVREAGLSIEYDPAFTITHLGGGSSGEPAARIGHFITGCLQLYGKHRSPRQRRRLTSFIRSALALRLLAGSLAAPRGFGKRKRETGELFRRLSATQSGGRPMKSLSRPAAGAAVILGTRIDALGMDDVLARACALARGIPTLPDHHRQRRPARGQPPRAGRARRLPGRRPDRARRRAPALGRPLSEDSPARARQRHRPDGAPVRPGGPEGGFRVPARRPRRLRGGGRPPPAGALSRPARRGLPFPPLRL